MDSQEQFIKEIYEKYNLTPDVDIFRLQLGKKRVPIITKLGIQKIIDIEKFEYRLHMVCCSVDYCAVECVVYKKETVIASSYGSAEAKNVRNPQKYFLEMAEKRAKVRAVLMAINAHGHIYSEEESDDFKTH